MIRRNCQYCAKEFSGDETAKYCSTSCRAKAKYRRRQKGLSGDQVDIPYSDDDQPDPKPAPAPKPQKAETKTPDAMPSKMSLPMPGGLDIHTQFVFDAQRKEIDRWEQAYKDENTRRQKLADDNARLRDELAEIKTENRIKEIEDAKPSALAGLGAIVTSDAFNQNVAPVLGKIIDRLLNGPSHSRPVLGAAPGAPADPADGGQELAAWFNVQPKKLQDDFFAFVSMLAQIKNPDQASQILIRIQNMLKPAASAPGSMGHGAAVNF